MNDMTPGKRVESLLPTIETVAGAATFLGGVALEANLGIAHTTLGGLVAGTILLIDGIRRT